MKRHHTVAVLVAVASLTAAISADTLYLRNGTRLQGVLVAVDDRIVQFEEDRGFGPRRLRDFDRDDVLRIELEPRRRYDAPGAGRVRPPGMRERLVIVTASIAWNDSGIEVRLGQEIYFEASGRVRWGRGREDGPTGEANSPSNPNRPMPNRPAAALIGKIGAESSDLFFIGAEPGPIRMRSGGRLFLGLNDDVLTDNTGNFRVIVYY